MEKKIPIDVVLIPSKEIVGLCKKLNAGLLQKGYPKLDEGYTPHVTLGMATVRESNIPVLQKVLAEKLRDFHPFEMHTEKFSQGAIAGFDIVATEEVRELHDQVMEVLAPFDTSDVEADDFYGGARSESVAWVNTYKAKYGSGNYFPHITLGIGTPTEDVDFPVTFVPDGIACFHLSDYCTCKKLLFNL